MTKGIRIIHPKTEEEFQEYYDLRYRLLREPWGMPNEIPEDEDSSIHYLVLSEDGKAIGVARVHGKEEKKAQVCFMATSPEVQGKGVGKSLLERIHKDARKRGYEKIILHARENAVGFYEKAGYEKIRPSHNLWGRIQHYLMEKEL